MIATESETIMPEFNTRIRVLVKEPGQLPTVATLPSSRLEMYEAWGTSPEPDAFNILYCHAIDELACDVVILSRASAMLSQANVTWNDHVAYGPVAIARRLPNGDFDELPPDRIPDIAAWMIEHGAGVDLAGLTYHGVSEGPGYDTVYVSRPCRKPERYALPHLERKSRIGFSWGYDGPSSFDLAVAILHDALVLDPVTKQTETMMALYQTFTTQYVATFATSSWELPGHMVMEWIKGEMKRLLNEAGAQAWSVPEDF